MIQNLVNRNYKNIQILNYVINIKLLFIVVKVPYLNIDFTLEFIDNPLYF